MAPRYRVLFVKFRTYEVQVATGGFMDPVPVWTTVETHSTEIAAVKRAKALAEEVRSAPRVVWESE